jgi:Na+/proline symporter
MEQPPFTPETGLLLLAAYAFAAFALGWLASAGREATKAEFLVASRNLGTWSSAFSIAATWIWAPALFIAAEEAYTRGFVGLFWFTVPNVACLIIFGFFAERMRERLPEGYTLSHYVRQRFSPRVQRLYWVELIGLATCSFAVQLLAGGLVVSALTGIPFVWVTLAFAAIALSYSLFSGLRGSVATDVAQLAVIFLIGVVVIPWAVAQAGLSTVPSGYAGLSGEYRSLWAGAGSKTAWSFGIPVTLGLLAGPFGDQSFWQRAFATEQRHVRRAFTRGALLFAVVPLLMSLLGFVAAGSGWETANPELIAVETVRRLLPTWVLLPLTVLLLSGLASTLDSNLCAIASLVGHDMTPEGASGVRMARFAMTLLAVGGVCIANVPGMQILYLFLFYGTLRAATLLPTALSLTNLRLSERGVFWGILAAFCLGLPVFAWGNFQKLPEIALIGSLTTVLLSGACALFWPGPQTRHTESRKPAG